jgi:hypothetical protein
MTAYYCTVSNGTGSGYHNAGSPFAIGAIVPAGYAFTVWSGAGTGGIANTHAANTTCTIYGTSSIQANFAHILYSVTYSANAGGGVSGNTSQHGYYGDHLTAVTASASPGHHFTGWSDGNMSLSRTDTVNGSASYTAGFEINGPAAPEGTTNPGYIAWFEVNND